MRIPLLVLGVCTLTLGVAGCSSATVTGLEAAPAPSVPARHAPSPLPTVPATPTSAEPEAVRGYLTARFTYAHDTDIPAFTRRLEVLGATGMAATAFPLTGAAYAACITAGCSTDKVSVRLTGPPVSQDGYFTWPARVGYRIVTADGAARSGADCSVTTYGGDITGVNCSPSTGTDKENS